MATTRKEKYVVDSQGNRTAVLLDIKEYKQMLEHLEDLEDLDDIRHIKEHLREASVPYGKIRKQSTAKK